MVNLESRMSIQSKFRAFDDKIRLGRKDVAYANARAKDDSITAKIKDVFKENGYPVIEDFIQGSLETWTTIKQQGQDFDIDRAIVIDADDSPNDPIIPKRVVLEILEKRGFKNAKIKKPCVTADYKTEDLHIDIPIYRKYQNGEYELAVGKLNSSEDNKEWSRSAPKELIHWVNNSDIYDNYKSEKLAQFRRLVRYVKRWRNENFSEDVARKVFSIGLTVMLKQHFKPKINDEGFADDITALSATISSILNTGGYFKYKSIDTYTVHVTLPVNPYRNIFKNSSTSTATQLRNKFYSLNSTLQQVIDEDNESKQCEKLIKIFGEDFPTCSSSNSSASSGKTIFSSAGAVGTSQGA